MIKEWDYLRVVACLSILLLHTSSWVIMEVGVEPEQTIYLFLRIALCYATPTFIVLSILILANRYREQIPTNFWSSRIHYIFVPFLVWAFIDASLVESIYLKGLLWEKYVNNVVYGEFVGWFVVVIMQLYVVFALMKRFKWSFTWFLPVCVLITLIHHTVILLPYPIFTDNAMVLRLLFTGWLGYFAVAYAIGMYYSQIAEMAKKYRVATIVLVLLAAVFLYMRLLLGYTEVHSRRLDLVPLVMSVVLFVIAWGQSVPHTKVARIISQYAFMIYLMHWGVLRLSTGWFVAHFDSTLVRVPLLMLWTLVVCIVLTKLISLLPFSQWIVGKIRKRVS
ncbi:membrane-bound acyltransferase YfiQ involved in biofilm formation [Lysinibacillus parviboronicapiens]|uniref:Membrane-bound acyltransferase YfiQ involved in biofilm formation n=1 Tax=Lysinibacillus parviboronicapiens TaxID=436516 RepID=A0ABV2PI64_9BACI